MTEHKSCSCEDKLPEIADGKFERDDMTWALWFGFGLGLIAGAFISAAVLEALYGI